MSFNNTRPFDIHESRADTNQPVVKEGVQPEHYTEFGAGSGDQADQVAGGFPQPSPTYIFWFLIFVLFFRVFDIF